MRNIIQLIEHQVNRTALYIYYCSKVWGVYNCFVFFKNIFIQQGRIQFNTE